MYIPPAFVEGDPAFIRNFIRNHAFATLISSVDERPTATHLPLDLRETTNSGFTLRGHMARANPQWRTLDKSRDVLAVFSGPNSYISASWYATTSVPTWNYIAIHVYGRPRIIDDRQELYEVLKALVDHQEGKSPESVRYSLEGAPLDFLEKMMAGIVGFEIEVSKVEAAAKLSQNRDTSDYENVIARLRQRGDPGSMEVVKAMEQRRKKTLS